MSGARVGTSSGKVSSLIKRSKGSSNVADKAALGSLFLKLKYEDAFVAWINGVEVSRSSNVTGTPAYNTTSGARSENLAIAVDSIDVSTLGLPWTASVRPADSELPAAEFSGNPRKTPRYDYNQILYRLDLDDPKLAGAK
mgnify:CR=1 FL=1